jgi:hypothetical protein
MDFKISNKSLERNNYQETNYFSKLSKEKEEILREGKTKGSSESSDDEEKLAFNSKNDTINQIYLDKNCLNSLNDNDENCRCEKNKNILGINNRKMSSPVFSYFNGFEQYLIKRKEIILDFSKSSNFIKKEDFLKNNLSYGKKINELYRTHSFNGISDLNNPNNYNNNLLNNYNPNCQISQNLNLNCFYIYSQSMYNNKMNNECKFILIIN